MKYRKARILSVIACCLFFMNFSAPRSLASHAGITEFRQAEDTLVALSDSMFNAFIPDMRRDFCEQFVKVLVRTLKMPNSYQYDFPKLRESINIISPDDKSFRIFNWVIETSEVTVRYYGAIQLNKETLQLYPLVDYSTEFGKAEEDTVLTGGKWYGALYYRILTRETSAGKVYTLLGKNSSSLISDKKVAEPLVLSDQGPVFGLPIFNVSSHTNPNKRINRFILEYRKDAVTTLNWDSELNAICFDRLVSQVNDPNRKYTFIPSGEYDGFRWERGQWNFVRDLIPIQVFKDGDAPNPIPIIKAKE